MREVFNLDWTIPNNGDYIKVELQRNDGQSYDGCLAKYNNAIYLLSNLPNFNGWHSSPVTYFQELGFRYAWSLCDGELSFADVIPSLTRIGLAVIADKGLFSRNNIFFFSEGYTDKFIYRGYHPYHSHSRSGMNTAINDYKHRIGCEIEVEFNNPEKRSTFVNLASNWFYCERDGSLDDSRGCEIVTIPLRPEDAKCVKFWEKLTMYLHDNAVVNGRCGFHVHIGKEIFGNEDEREDNIGKLLYFYHHLLESSELNRRIFGRDRGYHADDGKTAIGDSAKKLGSSVFKYPSVKQKVSRCMYDKSGENRYFDINIINTNTVEFRKGAGTISAERITAIIEYCELMCKYSCVTKWQNLSYESFVAFISKKTKNPNLQTLILSYK